MSFGLSTSAAGVGLGVLNVPTSPATNGLNNVEAGTGTGSSELSNPPYIAPPPNVQIASVVDVRSDDDAEISSAPQRMQEPTLNASLSDEYNQAQGQGLTNRDIESSIFGQGEDPNAVKLEMYKTGQFGKLSKLIRFMHKIDISQDQVKRESFTIKDTIKELLSELSFGKIKNPENKNLEPYHVHKITKYYLPISFIISTTIGVAAGIVAGVTVAAAATFTLPILGLGWASVCVGGGFVKTVVNTYQSIDLSQLKKESLPKTVGKAVAVALITLPTETLQGAVKLPIRLLTFTTKLVKFPFKLMHRFSQAEMR